MFSLGGRQIVRRLRPLAVTPAASAPAATSATAPAAGIAFRARWPALFAVAAVARRNHFGRFFLALGFARRALIGSRLRNEAAARAVFLATAPAPAPAPAASIAVLDIAAFARTALAIDALAVATFAVVTFAVRACRLFGFLIRVFRNLVLGLVVLLVHRRCEGHRLRGNRLGLVQAVHLLALFEHIGDLAADSGVGIDHDGDAEAFLERAQMGALLVEEIERDVGARTHDQIVGRAFE